MRVLVILDSVARGGKEMLTMTYLRKSLESQHRYLFAFFRPGALEQQFRALPVPVHFFRRSAKLDFSVILGVRKLIQSEKIDVLIVNQPFEALYAIVASAFLPRVAILQVVHGYYNASRCWQWLDSRILSRFVTRTVTVSRAARQELGKRGYRIDRMGILPNCIDFSRYPGRTDDAPRKAGPESASLYLVGMLGNFVRAKEQIVLIDAISQLRSEGIKISCLLAGAPADHSAYQSCVERCQSHDLLGAVEFLGSVDDVPSFLTSLDLSILAAPHETFGIVGVETVACGVPLVVPDVGVMREVLGEVLEQRNYYMPGNSDDLARCIREHFELWKSQTREAYDKRGLLELTGKYDVHAYVTRLDGLLAELRCEK